MKSPDKIKKEIFISKEEFISFLENRPVQFKIGSETTSVLKATKEFLIERMRNLLLMTIWDQEYHYNWLSEKDERTYFMELNKKKVLELLEGDWSDFLPFLYVENYSLMSPTGFYLTVDVVWEKRKEFYQSIKDKYVLPIRQQLEKVYPQNEEYEDEYEDYY